MGAALSNQHRAVIITTDSVNAYPLTDDSYLGDAMVRFKQNTLHITAKMLRQESDRPAAFVIQGPIFHDPIVTPIYEVRHASPLVPPGSITLPPRQFTVELVCSLTVVVFQGDGAASIVYHIPIQSTGKFDRPLDRPDDSKAAYVALRRLEVALSLVDGEDLGTRKALECAWKKLASIIRANTPEARSERNNQYVNNAVLGALVVGAAVSIASDKHKRIQRSREELVRKRREGVTGGLEAGVTSST